MLDQHVTRVLHVTRDRCVMLPAEIRSVTIRLSSLPQAKPRYKAEAVSNYQITLLISFEKSGKNSDSLA